VSVRRLHRTRSPDVAAALLMVTKGGWRVERGTQQAAVAWGDWGGAGRGSGGAGGRDKVLDAVVSHECGPCTCEGQRGCSLCGVITVGHVHSLSAMRSGRTVEVEQH